MAKLVKNAKGHTLVTLIPGDGIGPECVDSAKKIIDAAGVNIEWEVHHAGESIFKKGIPSGVPQETIDSMEVVRQMFAAGLLTSAFRHRFVLTRHSGMYGRDAHYGFVEPTWIRMRKVL